MMRNLLTGVVVMAAGGALAAGGGVTRKLFDRMDVPAGYETVVGSAELPAGASIGRHTHHGVEFGYVAEGAVEFTIDGEKPYRQKAGDFYRIDAGKVHDAKSIGAPAKVIAIWVVEKGKPLAEPAR
ncbi:MAG: cupin domain-containing protein [Rhodospirillaceae bacterium]|nr:cupin domain-containing protein [Rhodospirillaceae bacterium]